MADNYEDDHLKTAPDHANHKPSPDQVCPPKGAALLAFGTLVTCRRLSSEVFCSCLTPAGSTLTQPFL